MPSRAHKKSKVLVALAVLAICASVTGAQRASAAPVSINLCATTGTATMPGAVSVPIWGFVRLTGAQTCSDVSGTAQLPGPVLEVNVGDAVTVNVSNDLPAGHSASFELPGLAVTNGGGSSQFSASRSGTFEYQSSGDAGRQIAMGLYGALVVRPVGESPGFGSGACSAVAGSAYGNAFNRECVLVLSAIDPAFNGVGQPVGYDPNDFDLNDYLATYWLINGKAYPDTAPGITATAGQNVLLRYVNAGYDNTSMTLLGTHEHVIARDAYSLNNPFDADAETIPAGGTEDAIATMPAFAPPTANGFPLFNRNLHVTNGLACLSTNPCVLNPNHKPGGMLIFIHS